MDLLSWELKIEFMGIEIVVTCIFKTLNKYFLFNLISSYTSSETDKPDASWSLGVEIQ